MKKGHLAASGSRLALHRCGLDLDWASTGSGSDRGSDAVLDLGSHGHEGLLNIGRVLGRRLEEWNA